MKWQINRWSFACSWATCWRGKKFGKVFRIKRRKIRKCSFAFLTWGRWTRWEQQLCPSTPRNVRHRVFVITNLETFREIRPRAVRPNHNFLQCLENRSRWMRFKKRTPLKRSNFLRYDTRTNAFTWSSYTSAFFHKPTQSRSKHSVGVLSLSSETVSSLSFLLHHFCLYPLVYHINTHINKLCSFTNFSFFQATELSLNNYLCESVVLFQWWRCSFSCFFSKAIQWGFYRAAFDEEEPNNNSFNFHDVQCYGITIKWSPRL